MGSEAQFRAGESADPRLPDRYRLRRHLATGGMASVWCADDLVLDRTVAIKVLAERSADDDVALRRFKREARAAARVSTHPHVVTVFDVGDLPGDGDRPGRAFIVMEHLAGGTVADAIRVGVVRRREAMRWLHEAASALDFAHERGIVHRDIKPANFLLDRSRVLHVADFGIARLVSEDTITSTGEMFGTAAYLSPEQAVGQNATGASDRYALAVAAFELLTGGRPFTAQQFTAQARQHIEAEPPRASERDRTIPPAADEVLARGMAKRPDERFETAGEMVNALEAALSGIPMARPRGAALAGRTADAPARPLPLPERRQASIVPSTWASPVRRHLGRGAALAALLVATAGVLVLALSGATAPHRPARTTAPPTVRAATPPKPARTHRASTVATTSASTSTSTSTSAPPPATATPPSAEQLQITGHDEMLAGNYQTAIATLRQAVSAAVPGSLTYAYGLYDLGRSLVLAGDPSGAVPILEERLKIPNQTAVVREMLDEALRASGQVPAQLQTTTSAQNGGAGTSPPSGHRGARKPGTGQAPRSGGVGIGPPTPSNGNGSGSGTSTGNGSGTSNGNDGDTGAGSGSEQTNLVAQSTEKSAGLL